MRVRERLREACVAGNMSAGTYFTRFTSTKVQILTQNALGSEASGPSHGVPPRSILKY